MERKIWELARSKERVPLLEVYQAILAEARYIRTTAAKFKNTGVEASEKNAWNAEADGLYRAAAALENTEEINPTIKSKN